MYTPLGRAGGIGKESVACQRHSVSPVEKRWRAGRLADRRQGPALKDQPPAGSPVPAHAIDLHRDRARAGGVHVDPLGLTRSDRLLGDVALDRSVGRPAEEARGAGQAPGGGPRRAVLDGDRRRLPLGANQPAIGGGPAAAPRPPGGRSAAPPCPRPRRLRTPTGAASSRASRRTRAGDSSRKASSPPQACRRHAGSDPSGGGAPVAGAIQAEVPAPARSGRR